MADSSQLNNYSHKDMLIDIDILKDIGGITGL